MEEREATVRTEEWHPSGHPCVILSPKTKADHRDWKRLGLPGESPFTPAVFQVLDPLYHGNISDIRSKPSAEKRGGIRDSLFNYELRNNQGGVIAKVDTRGGGRITVFDNSLTPMIIAEALQAVQDALARDNSASYRAFGLFHKCKPDNLEKEGIPDEQILKNRARGLVIDPIGNVWVIKGKFERPNAQLDAQRPSS